MFTRKTIASLYVGAAFLLGATTFAEEKELFPCPDDVERAVYPINAPRVYFDYPRPQWDLPDNKPIAQLPEILSPSDPIEGFNRVMMGFDDFLMRWVARPVGSVYASVLPRHAMEGIGRMGKNLEWPCRCFSCLLQGRASDAGEDSAAFLINLTLGLVGFYDVADDWFNLKSHDEDFGQAFASWGMGPGCYLCLPFLGPSTVRDGVGSIFDMAFDIKSYIPYGGSWLFRINQSSQMYEEYDALYKSYRDHYIIARDLWFYARQLKINDREFMP